MFCEHCGARIEWDYNYCANCGHKLKKGPLNSPEVIAKVASLQPELDKAILQTYMRDIRADLDTLKKGPQSCIQSVSDLYANLDPSSSMYRFVKDYTSEDIERIGLNDYETLKQEYSDYVNKKHMSSDDEEIYIEKRAHTEMNRFGACHRIWNIKKDILLNDYGITWYTPDETNPDVHFD